MDYEIINGTYRDYVFLFKECRNAFADMSAKTSSKMKMLYFIRDERLVYGFICLDSLGGIYSISYIGVLPEYRNRGFGSQLVKYVKRLTDKIVFSVNEDTEAYKLLKPILDKEGFYIASSGLIFHSSDTMKSLDNWFAFRGDKLSAICNFLRRQGYREVPFFDMTIEQREYLANSKYNDYGNKLDPKILITAKWNYIEQDISFAAYLHEELVAYVLAIKLGTKSIIFEHISVSKSHIGRGVILLPFVRAIYAFCEKNYNEAVYKMHVGNVRANAFRKKLLGDIKVSKRRCIDYIYTNMVQE